MNVTDNHEAASVSIDKSDVLCLFDVCFEVGHGASQVGAVEARPASAPLHVWGLGPAAVFCPWRLGRCIFVSAMRCGTVVAFGAEVGVRSFCSSVDWEEEKPELDAASF